MQFPKNFRKISNYLEHKSERDCVSFYYLRKHNLDLKRRLQKGRGGRKSFGGSSAPRAPSGPPAPFPRQAVDYVPPPPSPPKDDPEWVTNSFRSGMRARSRNFSYNESGLGRQVAAVVVAPQHSPPLAYHV